MLVFQLVKGITYNERKAQMDEMKMQMNEIKKLYKKWHEARSQSAFPNKKKGTSNYRIIDPTEFPKPAPSHTDPESTPHDLKTAKNSLQDLPLQNNSLAVIGQSNGKVTRYHESTNSYLPVSRGFSIGKPTTFLVSKDSTLILSFPRQIAALVSENSRIMITPPQNGIFEVVLFNGTISVLMDRKHDSKGTQPFSVRTLTGITRSFGSFFAVTHHKNQSYSMAKHGRIIKETILSTKPDFSSYLHGTKSGFSSSN